MGYLLCKLDRLNIELHEAIASGDMQLVKECRVSLASCTRYLEQWLERNPERKP